MNRDIFLQLLLHAPDRITAETLLQSYPEFTPKEDSPYWLKLLSDRYPEERVVDLRETYLDRIDPVSQSIKRLINIGRSLTIKLIELEKYPQALDLIIQQTDYFVRVSHAFHRDQIHTRSPEIWIKYGYLGHFNGYGFQLKGYAHGIYAETTTIRENDLRKLLQAIPTDLLHWN